MKTCDDIIKDFKLGIDHCHSCHAELDEGYLDPQPIIINGITYDTPCCSVDSMLSEKNIGYEYA